MEPEQEGYQPSEEEVKKAEEAMTPRQKEMSQRREKLLKAAESKGQVVDVTNEEALDHIVASFESGLQLNAEQFIGGMKTLYTAGHGLTYTVDKEGGIHMLPEAFIQNADLIKDKLIEKGLFTKEDFE